MGTIRRSGFHCVLPTEVLAARMCDTAGCSKAPLHELSCIDHLGYALRMHALLLDNLLRDTELSCCSKTFPTRLRQMIHLPPTSSNQINVLQLSKSAIKQCRDSFLIIALRIRVAC